MDVGLLAVVTLVLALPVWITVAEFLDHLHGLLTGTNRTAEEVLGNLLAPLSGWQLAKGVQFEFPAGSTIAPGQFVVVAKDAALLTEFYRVEPIGEFKKSLSNSGDEIQLKDRAGKVVEAYFSHYPMVWRRGQWSPLCSAFIISLRRARNFSPSSTGLHELHSPGH